MGEDDGVASGDDGVAGGEGADGTDPIDEVVEDVAERPPGNDDPFERLGEGADRRGDPFEHFEGGDGAGLDTGGADDAPSPSGAEPKGPGADPGVPGDSANSDPSAESTNPFAGFEAAAGDPFDEESVFAAVDAGDADGVWERMDPARDADAADVPGQRYVEVSKHSYCERCEHFSPPPEVECSHEGTEILEFTDMETARVLDCPIVEERRALEDE